MPLAAAEPVENAFIRGVLRSMNVEAFDPRVVDHLRHFVAAHALQVVDEAEVLRSHAERDTITVADVEKAVERRGTRFHSRGVSVRRTRSEKDFIKLSGFTNKWGIVKNKHGAAASGPKGGERAAKRARSSSASSAGASARRGGSGSGGGGGGGSAQGPPRPLAKQAAKKITINPIVLRQPTT